MNTQNKERGGIVIFAVIGVLLVSLLAGGLYFGKRQMQTAQSDKPPVVAIDTEKEAAKADDKPAAPAKEETESAPVRQDSTPATTPKPTPTPTPTPAITTPASASAATVPVSGPSEALPSTGPSDILLGVVVVMAMTFTGLVFLQSNFRLRHSALNR